MDNLAGAGGGGGFFPLIWVDCVIYTHSKTHSFKKGFY